MKKKLKLQIPTLLIVLAVLFTTTVNVTAKSALDKNMNNFDSLMTNLKIKRYMRIMDVPSAVACVIKNNSVIWSDSYGYSNVYQRKKATLDSIYIIGSNSKSVVGTAFMQLYERGLVDLDENINSYLPFEIFNPNYPDINITARMLLAHQSSLSDNLGDLASFYKYMNNRSKWVKERITVDGELYKEHYWGDFKPGEQNYYSNMGFITVSLIVEIISTINDIMMKPIFE